VSKSPAPKPPPQAPSVLFRREIEAAIAAGASAKKMTLRLTLNDGRRLRRDDTVPLEQISYRGGEMHFLGVRVLEGGVAVSALDQSAGA
jgi:hypothetical protein